MADWQWEQGRTEYFQFENLRLMSRILVEKEGMLVSNPQDNDDLRVRAQEATGLDFPPNTHTVWRNYGRAFQAALLATANPASSSQRRLVCTNLCRALAENQIESATDYILRVAQVFYLPGPIFGKDKHRPDGPRVFPFCAVIRLLLAKSAMGNASVSADDVKDYLFGAETCGNESWDYYVNLEKRPRKWGGSQSAQKRQVREMLIFIAQAIFLKWNPASSGRLCLDLPPDTSEHTLKELFVRISPIEHARRQDAAEEILALGSWPGSVLSMRLFTPDSIAVESGLVVPGEGNRRRVNHLVIERSPKLREMYFSRIPSPVCDVTKHLPNVGFPWAKNLLEIHHIMPLSSSARADKEGETKMDDLVALTPTSHRAVHVYYRQWLRDNHKDDFSDRGEALRVYQEAKQTYQEHHQIRT